MGLYKFLFNVVITMIIFYFIWGIVKRLLLAFFRAKIGQAQHSENPQKQDKFYNNQNRYSSEGIKWDAETIDYEDVPEK